MSWEHRKSPHGYHEWTYEVRRRFQNKEVWAKAVVTAMSGDYDAPANWETWRDGDPIGRGHAPTVKQAKQSACRALWKSRLPPTQGVRRYGAGR